jgi:hypothetical protein
MNPPPEGDQADKIGGLKQDPMRSRPNLLSLTLLPPSFALNQYPILAKHVKFLFITFVKNCDFLTK